MQSRDLKKRVEKMPDSNTQNKIPPPTTNLNKSKTLNPLDKETFMELLRTIGLPGIIIVAWLIALVTGSSNAENLYLWGSVLAGSVFVNFMVFQLSSWKDAIVVDLKGIIQHQIMQTMELLELMMASQTSMVNNLNKLISIEEGQLTLLQLKKLIVFYYCESLKWKTWQTILVILDPAILQGVTQLSIQKTVEIHALALLKQLATYNKIMLKAEIVDSINNAIKKVFDIVFDEKRANTEDYVSRVHQLMDAIKIEYDNCATEIEQILTAIVE